MPLIHWQWEFGQNRSLMKGNLVLRPEDFFVCVSPILPEGMLTHHTWHSLSMRHQLWKFGRNRAVMKGTLLLRPKQFFVPVPPRITCGWLKTQPWYSLLMRHNYGKFGRNRAVTRAVFYSGRNSFSSLCRVPFQGGNSTRGIPRQCATNTASLVEVCQWWSTIYSSRRKSFSSISDLAL
jgi:hypothetical protein